MKYAFVKIEKLSSTLKALASLKGDMLPIRIEVSAEHYAKAVGEDRLKQAEETGVLSHGIPVKFVTMEPGLKVVIADSVQKIEVDTDEKKSKKAKKKESKKS